MSFLGGAGGKLPGKLPRNCFGYALRCNLVHFESEDIILKNVTVYAMTLSCLDYFSNIVTYKP